MNLKKYLSAIIVTVATSLFAQLQAQSPTLSLEDCKRMAMENNKKIVSAQYEIDAARSANKAAKLNDLPSLSASLIGAHVGKPLDLLVPQNIANASLDVQQPIYVGGKIRLGKEATAKVVEIKEGQKKMTEADVLLAVATAYWQTVQVKEKIRLAEKYRDMLKVLQKDLKNSYDAGLIYKNDLLRVEVSLNEAELNIQKARDGWVLSKLNLAQLIGQPGASEFNTMDSITSSFQPLSATEFTAQVENRPEINVLKKAIEAEAVQTKITRAEMKPTIGLGASAIGAGGKHVNFKNGKDQMATYYAMVNVSVPIFDWGKNKNKVSEQQLMIQSKQLQLQDTKELINLQVQDAYLKVNQSVQKIKLSTLSLQQADENLRLANDRYKAGTIVGKDVQEAQAIWQQAYSSLIDAKVEYNIHEASYLKAIGTLR